MSPKNRIFVWPIRIYYEDTDAGGLVYHSRYLNFLERARSEWLRTTGIEQDVLMYKHSTMFVLSKMELDYLRPARFNDQILVHTLVPQIRRASLMFEQSIHRERDNSNLLKARVRIACLDAASYRPQAIPKPILQAITYE